MAELCIHLLSPLKNTCVRFNKYIFYKSANTCNDLVCCKFIRLCFRSGCNYLIWFVAGSETGYVSLYDTRQLGHPVLNIRPHTLSVHKILLSPSFKEIVATGSDDCSVQIHNTNHPQQPLWVYYVTYSSSGFCCMVKNCINFNNL